jgi:hypothetical protein
MVEDFAMGIECVRISRIEKTGMPMTDVAWICGDRAAQVAAACVLYQQTKREGVGGRTTTEIYHCST